VTKVPLCDVGADLWMDWRLLSYLDSRGGIWKCVLTNAAIFLVLLINKN
jgi:hypothetical protein